MKKFILTAVMSLLTVTAFCQRVHFRSVYTVVDTLVVKNIQSVHPTKDGDYLITLPKEQNLVIAYNNDHSKAIVLQGYVWGKKMPFNVKYDGLRQILWFKDEHLYCGYIYDIKSKSCQYFEAINENEKERLEKQFKWFKSLRMMPTFTDE